VNNTTAIYFGQKSTIIRPVYTTSEKGVYVLWEPTEHKQDDSLVGRQATMRTNTCDSQRQARELISGPCLGAIEEEVDRRERGEGQ